eukprot:13859250-Alexandrium_andersonii.AAC.1
MATVSLCHYRRRPMVLAIMMVNARRPRRAQTGDEREWSAPDGAASLTHNCPRADSGLSSGIFTRQGVHNAIRRPLKAHQCCNPPHSPIRPPDTAKGPHTFGA